MKMEWRHERIGHNVQSMSVDEKTYRPRKKEGIRSMGSRWKVIKGVECSPCWRSSPYNATQEEEESHDGQDLMTNGSKSAAAGERSSYIETSATGPKKKKKRKYPPPPSSFFFLNVKRRKILFPSGGRRGIGEEYKTRYKQPLTTKLIKTLVHTTAN